MTPHVLHVTSMSRTGSVLDTSASTGKVGLWLRSQGTGVPLGGTGCPLLWGLEVSHWVSWDFSEEGSSVLLPLRQAELAWFWLVQ